MGSVQKRLDGKWRGRYRDPAGKEHARHFDRKLDAQRWVDAQETTKSRGEWIDPALSRVTVGAWATEWFGRTGPAQAVYRVLRGGRPAGR